MIQFVYRFLTTGVHAFGVPIARWYGRHCGTSNETLIQRLGDYPKAITKRISGRPRIWIHAASVGEVGGVVPVVEILKSQLPHCGMIVSTITTTGQQVAKTRLGNDDVCIYAPLDLIPCLRSALSVFRPDILVFMETELWPNWLTLAHTSRIPVVMINGRISNRSFDKYMKIRPLLASALSRVDAFSMIQDIDAKRIEKMGAPTHRITVNGNVKFDGVTHIVDFGSVAPMRKQLNLDPKSPVVVAGSTRGNEDATVLAAFRYIHNQVPDCRLIIAPRHVEKAPRVLDMARKNGFTCQLRTAMKPAKPPAAPSVIVLDTMGELKTIYGLADVVFCGGSLEPYGGQNILEPAIWAKPVLHGPYMDDFADAADLLDACQGAFTVTGSRDLAQQAIHLLRHPRLLTRAGQQAKSAVVSNQGAAKRHADVIIKTIGKHI